MNPPEGSKCRSVAPGARGDIPISEARSADLSFREPINQPGALGMNTGTKSIVIVGGGFAGVYTARHLARRLPPGWRLTLFSQENHFIFTPLLGDVVGSSINPMHVVWPIRQMVPRATCRTAPVTAIDLATRQLTYNTPDVRP